jgi:hypothetical protein
MKSWRRPWQATGDKSNVGHPRGASRFIRVIPPSATPSTGHRTPLHRHRFATPYGLRSAAASPQPQGPNRPKRNYMAVCGLSRSITIDAQFRPKSSASDRRAPHGRGGRGAAAGHACVGVCRDARASHPAYPPWPVRALPTRGDLPLDGRAGRPFHCTATDMRLGLSSRPVGCTGRRAAYKRAP